MKIRVTMKNPDAVYDAVSDAARAETRRVLEAAGDILDEEDVFESIRNKIDAKVSKWFEYGEYITVEIDTDADTATVIKR